jgi:hypothetical protein
VGIDLGSALQLDARELTVRPVAGASPEETAAIAAALERFLRDTAPAVPRDDDVGGGAWLRAGRLEALRAAPSGPIRWTDPLP